MMIMIKQKKIDFDEQEIQKIHYELNTTEKGDLITLGSPQLGLEKISTRL